MWPHMPHPDTSVGLRAKHLGWQEAEVPAVAPRSPPTKNVTITSFPVCIAKLSGSLPFPPFYS